MTEDMLATQSGQVANGDADQQQPPKAPEAPITTRLPLYRRLWLRAFPLGFRDEFVKMLALAWPSIITTLLQFLLQTTSFIMCGHMSKEDLDGVALGNSLINVAGLSIGVGMSTACDTLFSQTYGSRNRRRMGLYVQRSFLLMNFAFMILACLHLNVRPLLILMQQVPEIAERAAMYMRLFLPGLLSQFNFLVLSRYLQNQNRMYAPMVAAFVGNVFNAAGQYVAIHVLGFSYLASAVLQAASLCLMFCLTLAHILISGVYRETWDGWKLDSMRHWGDFVKLSVPGIFLIALEEWSFEIATIVAGTLGGVQLGAQSIIFQLESISYMIPFGLSVAVNIRVGQQLGGMQPAGAAQSFRMGLFMTVVTALVTCNLFVFLRDYLPRVFTSDKEIVSTASRVIPYLGLFQLFDGISAVSCGAIRGTGRQLEGAVLLFLGYYVVGLPIGIPLALLTSLEVTGTWIGLLVGIAVEAVAFCCLVLRFNWAREAEKAQARVYGRHWRRTRRWEERRRRRLKRDDDDNDVDVDDDDDDQDDKDSQEGDGDDSQIPSETESEYAPLLTGGVGYGYGSVGSASAAAAVAVAVAADSMAVGAMIDVPRLESDEIAFYSDPETFCDPRPPPTTTATTTAVAVVNPRRGRRRQNRLGRYRSWRQAWSGGNLLYTGRFYSYSRLPLVPEDGRHVNEEEGEGEGEGEGEPSRRHVVCRLLAGRLGLLLLLCAALGGSVALMMWTDGWLDGQQGEDNSTTTAAATTAAATVLARASLF